MNINKQNIAIAELCGWSDIKCGPFFQCYGTAPLDSLMDDRQVGMNVPYYTSDLNAMHDAEKVYSDDDEWTEKYWMALYQASEKTRWPYDATAAQRAEAFLRVHRKWEDGE